jgi:thioredoxin-like negative regulator of GroEL
MAGILLIGGMKYLESANRAAKHERLASIRADIQAVNRPRMLEFYATWCGPCQQYGPVVDELQRKYYDVIDIQRLNIDDQKNKKLAALLEVHVVPTTCMFDRKGEEVNEVKGALNRETLDKYLQNLEAVK